MARRVSVGLITALFSLMPPTLLSASDGPSVTSPPRSATTAGQGAPAGGLPAVTGRGTDVTQPPSEHGPATVDHWSLVFVFVLSTFIGLRVVGGVSRLLHTPLMSLTNAISAIAVVGSIIMTGSKDHPLGIRILGAIALFASMTNIVSGFLITDRMLKLFKQTRDGGAR